MNIQLPVDMAPHPRQMKSSATLLQKPQKLTHPNLPPEANYYTECQL